MRGLHFLRRHAVGIALVVVLAGITCYFWRDFCLWRAEGQLLQRQPVLAMDWIARGQWGRFRLNAQACLLKIRAARRLHDFEMVERLVQQAPDYGVRYDDLERERLLAMAQTYQFLGMQSRWDDLLGDQRDDGPEIARAYYNWCMINHRPVQAEQTLVFWHKDYPQDPEPLNLLGRYYQSLQKWEGAEDAYRQARALAPNDDECLLNLANVLRIRLKNEEAIRLFDDYVERHPHDPVALRGIAQCTANQGDLARAVEIMQTSYRHNGNDFETQMAYGELLLSAGKPEQAVDVLEKAHHQVPEYANLAYTYAKALKATGKSEQAAPLFAFVAESRPELDRLNDFEERLRSHPTDLELRMKIAAVTAKYVSRREGIQWYEALLQMAPNHTPAHRALAELYRSVGKPDRAALHDQFATADPDARLPSKSNVSVPR